LITIIVTVHGFKVQRSGLRVREKTEIGPQKCS